MVKSFDRFCHVNPLASMLLTLAGDAIRYFGRSLWPNLTLAAENLFRRKQLALYQKRKVKPRRPTNAIRIGMVWLSCWFDWRRAVPVVQPKTFIR